MGPGGEAQPDGDLLSEVAQALARTFEALCSATPFELVEAEVGVPFVGILAGDSASAGLRDFRDVSLLAENIGPSSASDTWRVCISVAAGRATDLRVERYDAPAVT